MLFVPKETGKDKTSLQEDATQNASFNQSSYEANISRLAYKISIVDSMLFDNHPKPDLSSIHSNSPDDWSFDSESTNDSNLDNWANDSRLLDENFSSLLSSISRVQPPLDLNSSDLRYDSPNSTLRVNYTNHHYNEILNFNSQN